MPTTDIELGPERLPPLGRRSEVVSLHDSQLMSRAVFGHACQTQLLHSRVLGDDRACLDGMFTPELRGVGFVWGY